MATEAPLGVLFLWHQHQPFYKDPLSNRYELPWVRLHATKDYFDMVALLEEFPKIRSNFNLVPSLLAQLDDYAQGKAHDKFLAMSQKPAQELSFEEKLFILESFFMANWENMIDPFPRYRELLDKRGRSSSREDLARTQAYFKEQDFRDLQVWFNLAWFDPYWREKDPVIKALFEKGRQYTEPEKLQLVQRQFAICSQVVAKHRELQDKGQIEVTTTPFYHPILPLLCDTESARMAMPHVVLPKGRFVHPEDARHQIERAVQDYEQRFGRRPMGMWPSEGSVSEAAAHLMADHGIRWVATDEAILAKSMSTPFSREDIFEPYRLALGDKSLHFFFRDHELSDAIGFVYSGWDPHDAAKDFMHRLSDIRDRLKARDGGKLGPHVVPIILDGENCWEYYRDDGLPFLRELYRRLSEDDRFETVRASDYLDRTKSIKTIGPLWTGSWINGNFGIWIGHSEDNRAWDMLSRTREFLVNHLSSRPELSESPQAKLAWEEIYIAEGSDWCWWYGDDHSSGNDAAFDYLFRKHLMNVYSVLGEKVPEDLHLAIKMRRVRTRPQEPADFVTPQIDGRITSYFEWQAAGAYQTEAGATGTMHRAQNLIKSIYYGFDLQNVYFRIDPARPLDLTASPPLVFKILFLNPPGLECHATLQPSGQVQLQLKGSHGQPQILATGIAQKVIELAIPLAQIPLVQRIEAVIVAERENLEQERWPLDATFSFPYPSENSFSENWTL